jgi:hypothetical protein
MKEQPDESGGTMIERDIDDVPFTMIPNALLADTGISWKAKGVISYLLGKPAHWKARTKDIENHGTGGESEIRAALLELRHAGYARLERRTIKGRAVAFVYRVANKQKYTMDCGKRVDIALDSDRSLVEIPLVENPQVDISVVDGSLVENRDNRKKEGRKNDLSKNQNQKRISNSNKAVRAFGGGAAAADPTPSATLSGPRNQAEKFIQAYKQWGKAAKIVHTVVPKEREALVSFFTDNPEVSQEELTAMMLCAWMVPRDLKTEESDFNPFWFCQYKSQRIETFIENVIKIGEETNWTPSAKLIDKQYRLAEQKFLHQKAA